MRKYAVAVDSSKLQSPLWRNALKESRFKRLELSFGAYPNISEIVKQIEMIQSCNFAEAEEIVSIHIPFAPFELFRYGVNDERERKAAVAALRDFLGVVAPLKSPNYTFHASGEPVSCIERKPLLAKIRSTIEELAEITAAQKAALNIELLPRSCIGNCAEELSFLTDGFLARKSESASMSTITPAI